MRAERGFTLVEVLLALAVVAVALPAVLLSLTQLVDGTAYLRDKSHASLVAANRLEELRLLTRARREVLPCSQSGLTELAGREWYWNQVIETTPVEKFFRVEISVETEEGQSEFPLARLVAFMMGDLEQADAVPGAGDEGAGDSRETPGDSAGASGGNRRASRGRNNGNQQDEE